MERKRKGKGSIDFFTIYLDVIKLLTSYILVRSIRELLEFFRIKFNNLKLIFTEFNNKKHIRAATEIIYFIRFYRFI